MIVPPYFSGFEPLSNDDRRCLHPDSHPVYLGRDPSASAAILCFHGFTAMPYGVRPVAETCYRLGMDAIAPLQPGHGYLEKRKQRQAFSSLTPQAMLDAAREEVAKARSRYPFVGVYGDSMGGAIALALAIEGRIDACAATAPALKLPFRGEVLCAFLGWTRLSIPKRQEPNFYNPCYTFENARAGNALLQIARYVRNNLERVHCPVFVAHSHRDPIIPALASEWVCDRVAGPVETAWFDRSGHLLPLDCQGEEVCQSIGQFFQRYSATPQVVKPQSV